MSSWWALLDWLLSLIRAEPQISAFSAARLTEVYKCINGLVSASVHSRKLEGNGLDCTYIIYGEHMSYTEMFDARNVCNNAYPISLA
jgi:hypothetical protein